MRYRTGRLYAVLVQESGQIQLSIIAPILALSFLSLVVRTANSAVDPTLEKKKVTEQLKRRLSEVRSEEELNAAPEERRPLPKSPGVATSPPPAIPSFRETPVPLPAPQQRTRRVKKKETLVAILREEGLQHDETARWTAAARTVKGFTTLRVGQTITLFFAGSGQTQKPELTAIAYEVDRRTRLVLERKADGTIASRREILPTVLVWRAVGGPIDSNLYQAAKSAGVPVRLLDDLADMDWDIDLSSDLHPGDVFKVIFEEFQHQGKTVAYGQILAAEIVNRGKPRTLFSIAGRTFLGEAGSGRTGQHFLRYPLKFSRISSVFTAARFHPILGRSRPHLGVDFAAPAGTPVRSIAAGKVAYAGRFGGYGNYVRIDHPGLYASAYAHLQRIAGEVKVGSMVERGQVIGYVGATGLATGPHLHFELYKNGTYINPLTAKLPTREETWKDSQQKQLLARAEEALRAQLAALHIDTQPASVVRSNPLGGNSLHSAQSTGGKTMPQRFAFQDIETSVTRKTSTVRRQLPHVIKNHGRTAGRR